MSGPQIYFEGDLLGRLLSLYWLAENEIKKGLFEGGLF